ncbi:hypothetical protein [Kitasatospora viridis]|uniref:Uncharacterized protein n=1 Tax=Kitasatospora viridis TaxID=281105 RepID=A0A561SA01_9ACTN|nr:hypothetical protein [Kitasatospora viridis]TWF71700.1 hypothetical protein FHX73_1871 [Kitasatospora viridis]
MMKRHPSEIAVSDQEQAAVRDIQEHVEVLGELAGGEAIESTIRPEERPDWFRNVLATHSNPRKKRYYCPHFPSNGELTVPLVAWAEMPDTVACVPCDVKRLSITARKCYSCKKSLRETGGRSRTIFLGPLAVSAAFCPSCPVY